MVKMISHWWSPTNRIAFFNLYMKRVKVPSLLSSIFILKVQVKNKKKSDCQNDISLVEPKQQSCVRSFCKSFQTPAQRSATSWHILFTSAVGAPSPLMKSEILSVIPLILLDIAHIILYQRMISYTLSFSEAKQFPKVFHIYV